MSAGQVLNGPHLITTRAKLTVCHRCRRHLLAATVGGLDRHVDVVPRTPAGELAALLAGRTTYDLLGGDHLIRRDVHRIRRGDRRLPVLADHDCRPIDPGHVDHAHLEAAVAVVQLLLGGQVVADTNTAPPF